MDYYLIKGHFHVVGYSPGGDSLMFKASSNKHWDKLQSEYQDVLQEKLEGGNGAVQLRLQGVDALETHYSSSPLASPAELRGKAFSGVEKPARRNFRQPETYGEAATAELLSLLGVEQIKWKPGFGRRWIDEITVVKGNRRTTYGDKHKDRLEDVFLDSFFDDTNLYVFLIDERDFVRLNSIVYVTKTRLKKKAHPGNIVFLS